MRVRYNRHDVILKVKVDSAGGRVVFVKYYDNYHNDALFNLYATLTQSVYRFFSLEHEQVLQTYRQR